MIAIGSDHGGFDLKIAIIEHLKEKQIQYKDFGTFDKKPCDYPVYGAEVAKSVVSGECEKGIVICTTGVGMSIIANKYRGIRCALVSDPLTARLTRLHNDANILALGGGLLGDVIGKEIVDVFLSTEFSGAQHHIDRIKMISEKEKDC